MRYVDGFVRRLCVRIGGLQKRRFAAKIKAGMPLPEAGSTELAGFELVSFSGTRDFWEQCLSILSFVSWCGIPRKWTVYSDGTHSESQRKILEALGPFVEFANWDRRVELVSKDDGFLIDYATRHAQQAMGKRLCAYSTHPVDRPTLFLDSDILFYRWSSELLAAAITERPHWFLPDVAWGCLDTRYLRTHPRGMYQLNGGFYLISPGFSWRPSLEALRSFSPDFEYFSDQTSYHIGFLSQGAYPLDPRRFVIDTSDQFDATTPYRPSEMAIRHYTGPVRHKLWLYGWAWHLKASENSQGLGDRAELIAG